MSQDPDVIQRTTEELVKGLNPQQSEAVTGDAVGVFLLGVPMSSVAGGVAANSRIRDDFKAAAEKAGKTLYVPPLSLCGDNAAMIGCQGYYEFKAGNRAGANLNAYATMEL